MGGKNIEEIALEICRNVVDGDKYGAEVVDKIYTLVPKIIASVKIDSRAINEFVQGDSKPKFAKFMKTLLTPPNSRVNKVDVNKFLSVDGEKLTASITELAELISAKNKQIDALNQRYDEKFAEYYRYREQSEKQLEEYQIQAELVARFVQYEMSQRLKNAKPYEDLIEILNYMGLKAVLPEEVDAEKRAEFFTELKTDVQEFTSVKPCIQSGDEIFLRGEIIRYEEPTDSVD